MQTSSHSQFALATGELTGLCMSADLLALNTPPGHAWLLGVYDPKTHIVQLITDDFGVQQAVAVRRTPTRPADSVYQTWVWDESAWDWLAKPTLAYRKHGRKAPVLEALAALDIEVSRPTSEITQAQLLGEAPPAAAVLRLTEVLTEKAAWRHLWRQIEDATNEAELAAVPLAPAPPTPSAP
ncbi:hypothetical protein [Paucibacter sp. Y2R2-4]|uniref:hypothetical protein n=1 Tax=Paucibacter sp. Y2R2-4 TaxID=2893553 RepID=UPI0021E42AFB|nr:hypothetical protein [Paucibacter sp. Y2R2-4]MCV2349327.1 hypothetical protein [Paucibacter sp. Y2R2-4]